MERLCEWLLNNRTIGKDITAAHLQVPGHSPVLLVEELNRLSGDLQHSQGQGTLDLLQAIPTFALITETPPGK